jgi:hypothetical protein
METPIQKQDLAQTDDNIQTLRWVERLHTSDNDQITYLGFTSVLRKELLPLYFFVILFQVGKQSW